MSRYLDRSMLKGEHIIYAAELHWVVYQSGLLTTLFGVLFSRYAVTLADIMVGEHVASFLEKPLNYGGLVIIFVGALRLLYGFFRQISTELVITNQRVIAKHGFIATTTFEVMLSKVEGANIDQTIWGRLLGYGTVMVKGTGGGISPIDHVAKPYLFHSRLMEVLREAGQQRGARGGGLAQLGSDD